MKEKNNLDLLNASLRLIKPSDVEPLLQIGSFIVIGIETISYEKEIDINTNQAVLKQIACIRPIKVLGKTDEQTVAHLDIRIDGKEQFWFECAGSAPIYETDVIINTLLERYEVEKYIHHDQNAFLSFYETDDVLMERIIKEAESKGRIQNQRA